MKKLLFVIVAVVIITNLAFAGDENTPTTKSGDKALLFNLGGLSFLTAGNFTPTSFLSGVGGKYYISEGNAIRLALGFNNASTTIKNTTIPTPAGQSSERKETGTSFSIAPAFLHVLPISGSVAPYIGAQIAWTTNSLTREPGANFVNNSKFKSSTTVIGVAGLLGVEWFAWSNISFGAEYQLGYFSTSGSDESTNAGTTTTVDHNSVTSTSISSASSGNLTVSVYW